MATRNKISVEEWLESLEDAPVGSFKDASYVRRIVAAAENVTASEDQLRQEVAAARAAGESWSVIGIALGVTRQAAYQRFGTA
jgi:hypothetical protein